MPAHHLGRSPGGPPACAGAAVATTSVTPPIELSPLKAFEGSMDGRDTTPRTELVPATTQLRPKLSLPAPGSEHGLDPAEERALGRTMTVGRTEPKPSVVEVQAHAHGAVHEPVDANAG